MHFCTNFLITRWESGEPNDQSMFNVYKEDCVEMHEEKGFYWNDESCDSSRRYESQSLLFINTELPIQLRLLVVVVNQ